MKLKKVDWLITLVPLVLIAGMSLLFFIYPQESNAILSNIRFFFGDTLGSFYLIIGLFIFLISLYLAFSKYGNLVLGEKGAKPQYSFVSWGAMMFTCGLAADILFYSFSEWLIYLENNNNINGQVATKLSAYSLFHWSFIPWAFYLTLAVCFAYMLHIKKCKRQRFSEAVRPLIGKYSDSYLGRGIDLLAALALIAGTATTFSVATPLMSNLFLKLFSFNLSAKLVTIIIIIITCFVYTYSLLKGFSGIQILAKACLFLFFGLLAYIFVLGGESKFIIENGLSSLGYMWQNFITLATNTDAVRETNFPQNYTIYYWAYWMVWCVAAPFFIGNISKGRTIKQTILGGYLFGVGSTILSFIILGNYSLSQQIKGLANYVDLYAKNNNLYNVCLKIISSLPLPLLIAFVVFLTMIAFYATSFDSIAYTASCYSYKELKEKEEPHKLIQLLWCILLVILPLALVNADSSMSNLQSVSIIAAFPLGIIIVCIVISLFIELKKDK